MRPDYSGQFQKVSAFSFARPKSSFPLWWVAVFFGGHPSLTIIVCYAPILVSVLDPSSTVLLARNGEKNISLPGTQARN